ncbi:MAG: ATP-binding protein [Verrucomicrobia bacterium]|nr:ATP-binding protein [Verrucomicrobiota bacterium]
MTKSASFRVDPRLTAILGENYTSSERALRELIDNAWDAEATEVQVTLPAILSDDPIIVSDNGSGMKEQELRNEYLNIASPRLSRKGERTPNLLRIVKGRRGIGKFAGLILAETMLIETKAKGTQTRLTISKSAILGAGKDLESVPLPVDAEPCVAKEHGTTVTLRNLNQNLNFPKVDKLREILAYDYGRETDFVILVNGERVFRHDIQGQTFTGEIPLPNGRTATYTYTIADKPVPGSKAGIILRDGGKAIGRPHLFGLEHDEILSDRSKRRVVGEINLPPDSLELTAAGGDVIESDKSFEHLANVLQDKVRQSLTETHANEVNLAKGRWTQMMKRRLENVPEHRREIVEERLNKLISRSYQEGEKEERITVLISLVLDAMELDEYWTVCREIQEAEKVDVFHFADALEKFGLCDLAFIAQQAKRRIEFLDYLDRLASDDKTTEQQMHRALQRNLWVFGPEYSVMASNEQLQGIVRKFSDQHYGEADAKDRPDLFLAGNILKQHLLIEFKRPSDTVGRDAENQVKKYADSLTGTLGLNLQIVVIGGKVDAKLRDEYTGKQTSFAAYHAVIAAARRQLDWLLEQLRRPAGTT